MEKSSRPVQGLKRIVVAGPPRIGGTCRMAKPDELKV
jgi:hypothetical protein